jgi:hypothetical protein
MPFEGRQRAALLDRCWSIYQSVTSAFRVHESFHLQFPDVAESALVSGALHITVPIGADLTLSLREEYAFDRHKLAVSRYSYNVIDTAGNNLLRADNLPFHRTDYRKQLLTHSPNHIHNQRGRVFSFNGDVHIFIANTKTLLSSR